MFLPTNRFLIVYLLQWLSAISILQTLLPIVPLNLIVGAQADNIKDDVSVERYGDTNYDESFAQDDINLDEYSDYDDNRNPGEYSKRGDKINYDDYYEQDDKTNYDDYYEQDDKTNYDDYSEQDDRTNYGEYSGEEENIKYERYQSNKSESKEYIEFPDDYKYGVEILPYATEGAWDKDGRGESTWDRFVHNKPEMIVDRSTGDNAADFYHKYKEDIQRMKKIKTKICKIGCSLTRIFPRGYVNYVNKKGVEYYNNVINEMTQSGIEVIMVLFPWSLPQCWQEIGGWTNPNIINWISEIAGKLFEMFGDRVKNWVTIEDPKMLCSSGYGGTTLAPGLGMSGVADYMCSHHVLLAHLGIYKMYNRVYRAKQRGKIGFMTGCNWYVPYNRSSVADIEAAKRAYNFDTLRYLHPIYSDRGDYPPIMKNIIMKKSKEQGFQSSRLLKFTKSQIISLKKSVNFLLIKYYETVYVRAKSYGRISYLDDIGMERVDNKERSYQSVGETSTSWGCEKLLFQLKETFKISNIYMVGLGYPRAGEIRETDKVAYYRSTFKMILKAISRGINIKGCIFPLLDHFEWSKGYTCSTGIYKVDHKDRNKPRIETLYSKFIQIIFETGRIPTSSNYTCKYGRC